MVVEDKTVSRLASSMQKYGSGDFQEGLKAGKKWAEELAEARQLRRLSNWYKSLSKIKREELLNDPDRKCRSRLWRKVAEITVSFASEYDDSLDFWVEAAGFHPFDRRSNAGYRNYVFGPRWIVAFALGASIVWNRVQPNLKTAIATTTV